MIPIPDSTRRLTRILACAAMFSIALAHAEEYQGKVVGVTDGDTITLLTDGKRQLKIRLAGIDAPEKSQPFGQRSKQALSDMAFGKFALVEATKTDRYGRLIGKVLLNKIDLNLVQIRLGMAWHYKAYALEQSAADVSSYSQAESAARNGRVGIWAQSEPIAPWDWRRAKRSR